MLYPSLFVDICIQKMHYSLFKRNVTAFAVKNILNLCCPDTRSLYCVLCNNYFFLFFLPFLTWPLLASLCRCWGILLHLITHGDTHTHTHTHIHSIGLLWTRDRSITETSTWQDAKFTRETHPCLWRDFFYLKCFFIGPIVIHRTRNPSKRSAADLYLRPRGHQDLPFYIFIY